MKQYSWDGNQDVILLGLRNAGLYMKKNADHQTYLTQEESEKMKKFGVMITEKFEKCQESHLTDFYDILFNAP